MNFSNEMKVTLHDKIKLSNLQFNFHQTSTAESIPDDNLIILSSFKREKEFFEQGISSPADII